MIMNRSRSKNIYMRNKHCGKLGKYRKVRKETNKVITKEYFRNINVASIIDNKSTSGISM